jgi:hypothetical protein
MKPHILHVNRQHIAMNAKDGGNRPIYTIKMNNGQTRYAREVTWEGPSKAVYNGNQLSCGARAWIEVQGDLTLVDEMSFKEARQSA